MNQLQQIEDYKKQIYRKIPATPPTKSRCIDILDVSIEDYLVSCPDANFEDIVCTFGQPDEVVKQYMQEIDPEEIRNHKRKRLLCWVIPLAIFLILVCVFLTIGYFYIIKQEPGYIVESPAEDAMSEYEVFEGLEN